MSTATITAPSPASTNAQPVRPAATPSRRASPNPWTAPGTRLVGARSVRGVRVLPESEGRLGVQLRGTVVYGSPRELLALAGLLSKTALAALARRS